MSEPRKQSPHFFRREDDGSVRIRMRFDDPLPGLIEDAAGKTPLMVWIYSTLERVAREEAARNHQRRAKVAPPLDLDRAS